MKKLSEMTKSELIEYWCNQSTELELMHDNKEIDTFSYRIESGKIARILNHLMS
jgi:hypothetical protein